MTGIGVSYNISVLYVFQIMVFLIIVTMFFFSKISNSCGCKYLFLFLQIGLQQGLKMLRIFKSYSGVTSMLDDFNFYEKRERSLRAKRDNMRAPQTEMFTHHDFPVSSS